MVFFPHLFCISMCILSRFSFQGNVHRQQEEKEAVDREEQRKREREEKEELTLTLQQRQEECHTLRQQQKQEQEMVKEQLQTLQQELQSERQSGEKDRMKREQEQERQQEIVTQCHQQIATLEAEVNRLTNEKNNHEKQLLETHELRAVRLETSLKEIRQLYEKEASKHEQTREESLKISINSERLQERFNALEKQSEQQKEEKEEKMEKMEIAKQKEKEEKEEKERHSAQTMKQLREEMEMEVNTVKKLKHEVLKLTAEKKQSEKTSQNENMAEQKELVQQLEKSQFEESQLEQQLSISIEQQQQTMAEYQLKEEEGLKERDVLRATVSEQAVTLRHLQDVISQRGISCLLPLQQQQQQKKKISVPLVNSVNNEETKHDVHHQQQFTNTALKVTSLSSSRPLQQPSQKLFTLASTGNLERRLLVSVADNERLRRKLDRMKDHRRRDSKQRMEARSLLQNVTDLFGSLEKELSKKFGDLETELTREDAERQRIVEKLKQQMVTLNENSSIELLRMDRKRVEDVTRAEKRLETVSDEHQRVRRQLSAADSERKHLLVTLENCRDSEARLKRQHEALTMEKQEVTIQLKACREGEKAAYAALSQVRLRDSRVVGGGGGGGGAGGSGGGGGGLGYMTKRINSDIEEQQQVMIHSLRTQCETSVSEVGELRQKLKQRNDEISLLWRQTRDLEEERESKEQKIIALRRQRDALRTMFDKSQEVLKRTLVECQELQRTKVAKSSSSSNSTKDEEEIVAEAFCGRVKSSQNEETTLRSSSSSSGSIGGSSSESPRKSRETRGTLLRHIASIKGALEGFLHASTLSSTGNVHDDDEDEDEPL
jgi:hypothetical protein